MEENTAEVSWGAGDCSKASLLPWAIALEAWTRRWAGRAVWGPNT